MGDVRDSIATATETILNWLSTVANSIQEHKATPTYQEHARKSGTLKNKSGLTETELEEKSEKKRAARLKYGRQPSTALHLFLVQRCFFWLWSASLRMKLSMYSCNMLFTWGFASCSVACRRYPCRHDAMSRHSLIYGLGLRGSARVLSLRPFG